MISTDAVTALEHVLAEGERSGSIREAPGLTRREAPRALLVPSRVPELLGMAGIEWAWLVALWAGMAWLPWWLYPLLALGVAGRLHALAVIVHDTLHMAWRRRTAGIRLLEVLCAYPVATTLAAMRYHHLRHHRDNGMPTDPYFQPRLERSLRLFARNVGRGLLLLPFWTVRAPFGWLAARVPGLRTPYARIFLQDRSRRDLGASAEVIECGRQELGQMVFQGGLVILAVAAPRAVLWGYVVPAAITGVLAAWRLRLEHNYRSVQDRDVAAIFATTNDHHLGWRGRLLLAPRNIGYHVVHHIHPQVGLARLPALSDWYRRRYPNDYPRWGAATGPPNARRAHAPPGRSSKTAP